MLVTILVVLLIVGAIVLFVVGHRTDYAGFKIAAGVALAGGLVSLGLGSVYTQDPGEAIVLRSFTGEVVGSSMEEGLHVKAPWVDAKSYNIRNEQVVFIGSDDEPVRDGANGVEITVQDSEGVSADIDITVRYSIAPDSVVEIYRQFGPQESFISKFIENDIRAGLRNVPPKYGTLELLTSRSDVENDIVDFLEDRWEGSGVIVQSVSLQDIRYDPEVTARFSAAQAARIEVEKAQADLEAAEVNAQQKIVQAEAEAEANRVLAESLSPEILEQRKLDMLVEVGKGGNLVVVPEDFGGLVSIPGGTGS